MRIDWDYEVDKMLENQLKENQLIKDSISLLHNQENGGDYEDQNPFVVESEDEDEEEEILFTHSRNHHQGGDGDSDDEMLRIVPIYDLPPPLSNKKDRIVTI